MAIINQTTNVNYLEEDTGFNTRLSIFKYQRPRPGANLLKQSIGLITLPLPSNLPHDSYNMNLGDADLGLLGGITEFDANKGENLTKLEQTLKERLNASGAIGP